MIGATKKSRIWIWFAAAALVHAGVWSAWIAVASKHRVAEVPLAMRCAH